MPLKLAGQAVVVIDDEPVIRERVARALSAIGLHVDALPGRGDLFERVREGRCAALVLDLGLPGDDGLLIARELRQFSDLPILMLTGRAGIHERIMGLASGADDYLVKPFAMEELVARVRVMLRRIQPRAGIGVPVAVLLGPARLDLRTRQMTGPFGQQRLTEREARIVRLLAQAASSLSRAAISRDALGRVWEPHDRTLDVHVSNLRRKLATVLGHDGALATIRGEGFELRVPARIETEEPVAGPTGPR
jgi:DNA-binding response OmpR family regulator